MQDLSVWVLGNYFTSFSSPLVFIFLFVDILEKIRQHFRLQNSTGPYLASIQSNSIEVTAVLNCLLNFLCLDKKPWNISVEMSCKRQSYRSVTTWGWISDDRFIWTFSFVKSVSDPERNYGSTFNIFQSATASLLAVMLKLFKYQPFGHFVRNEASDIQMDGVICFTVCRFLLLYYSFPVLRPNVQLIMVSISMLPEWFSLFNCDVSTLRWLISAVIMLPKSESPKWTHRYSRMSAETISALHG